MAVFCLLCGKRFQTQKALQGHMEVHAGVRSYICSECDRTFPSHTALKRHLRSHTGQSRSTWLWVPRPNRLNCWGFFIVFFLFVFFAFKIYIFSRYNLKIQGSNHRQIGISNRSHLNFTLYLWTLGYLNQLLNVQRSRKLFFTLNEQQQTTSVLKHTEWRTWDNVSCYWGLEHYN